MAAELFVDTSAWYPIVVRAHPDHAALAQALRKAVKGGRRLVTSNLIVAETHALLLRRVGGPVALTFVQNVPQPPNAIVPSDAGIEAHAVHDWLERFTDQDLSFTDAVSFAIMAERDIEDALTLDHRFAAAGFRMIRG